MQHIKKFSAIEILDSRGRPTVKATCGIDFGGQTFISSASVPSGASTGSAETVELRDGDSNRYGGLGCRRAVAAVSGPINAALAGRDIGSQSELDRVLLDLDGTHDKSRLGANAILAASLAFARASGAARGVPLYRHFADQIGRPPSHLPRLTINLFSGGKHAGGQVPIQDVLVVPLAPTIDQGLAAAYAVYQAAARLTLEKYKARPLKADEGGLAPPFAGAAAMLDDAVAAIRAAGFEPLRDVALAVDVASTHFHHGDAYHIDGEILTSEQMIGRLRDWIARYPILSVEDGLAENDWRNWPKLREALHPRVLVLGDDLLCTNPARIRRAIEERCANALLLKVNQIGTLTEAAEALRLARDAGWKITVSARSGETEDDWLADLAVGWGADQIKVGSITQSERLAKYNRLLAIEAETRLPVTRWPA